MPRRWKDFFFAPPNFKIHPLHEILSKYNFFHRGELSEHFVYDTGLFRFALLAPMRKAPNRVFLLGAFLLLLLHIQLFMIPRFRHCCPNRCEPCRRQCCIPSCRLSPTRSMPWWKPLTPFNTRSPRGDVKRNLPLKQLTMFFSSCLFKKIAPQVKTHGEKLSQKVLTFRGKSI